METKLLSPSVGSSAPVPPVPVPGASVAVAADGKHVPLPSPARIDIHSSAPKAAGDDFEHINLVAIDVRDAQAVVNGFVKAEHWSWAALVVGLVVALALWAALDRSLWDSFHNPTVCTFVASDSVQRGLCWSAGSALVLLVAFSLYVERRMEDLRFDALKNRTPWGIAKKILIREFCIAGSLALILWFVEFVVAISEGNTDPFNPDAAANGGSGSSGNGDGAEAITGPHRRLLSTGVQSFYHAVTALLSTLEFFDKLMFLLTGLYMALVGVGWVVYRKTLYTRWGGMSAAHQQLDAQAHAQSVGASFAPYAAARDDGERAAAAMQQLQQQYDERLSLGVTHFTLNFPFYVKVASFLVSVVLFADILYPGEAGFVWFEAMCCGLFPLLFVWLIWFTDGQFAAQTGLTDAWYLRCIPAVRNARASASIRELPVTAQLRWARHTKYVKQYVGLLGCMTATVIVIWVLRCMCLRAVDVPWVLACIGLQIGIFVWVFVKLPRYVLFLYSNPFVSDPTRRVVAAAAANASAPPLYGADEKAAPFVPPPQIGANGHGNGHDNGHTAVSQSKGAGNRSRSHSHSGDDDNDDDDVFALADHSPRHGTPPYSHAQAQAQAQSARAHAHVHPLPAPVELRAYKPAGSVAVGPPPPQSR